MLASLTQLRSLSMAYTNITDPGARHVCALTRLTYISLDSRLISDAGLRQLPALTALQKLDLFGCKACRFPPVAKWLPPQRFFDPVAAVLCGAHCF